MGILFLTALVGRFFPTIIFPRSARINLFKDAYHFHFVISTWCDLFPSCYVRRNETIVSLENHSFEKLGAIDYVGCRLIGDALSITVITARDPESAITSRIMINSLPAARNKWRTNCILTELPKLSVKPAYDSPVQWSASRNSRAVSRTGLNFLDRRAGHVITLSSLMD